jgi:hypothetical protein
LVWCGVLSGPLAAHLRAGYDEMLLGGAGRRRVGPHKHRRAAKG